MAVIVGLAFVIRVWHVDYDQGMHSHPDERSNAFYAARLDWPSSPESVLRSTRDPLNPFWDDQLQVQKRFTYGHFPLYLGTMLAATASHAAPVLKALGLPHEIAHLLAAARLNFSAGLLPARLAIIGLDCLTVALAFVVARRIYGTRTGLLAALFYAVALQAVKDSHFFTFDPATAAFCMTALLGCVMLAQSRRDWVAVVLAGGGAGLAIASKFSALPVLALPALALLLGRRRAAKEMNGSASILGDAACLATVCAIAAVSFAVTSPFAILDLEWFWHEAITVQGKMVRGVLDFPFTRQYRGTLPYVYFIRQQLQFGLGYPLGFAALAGVSWCVARLPRRFQSNEVAFLPPLTAGETLLLAWLLLYFGPTGAFLAKFNRYMLPILPAAIIAGAGLLGWLCRWWGERRPDRGIGLQSPRLQFLDWRKLSGPILVCATLGTSFLWLSGTVTGVWGKPHTWLEASYWMYEQVPDGSSILWEVWDDPLPVSATRMPERSFPGSVKKFSFDDWNPFDEDTASKLEILKRKLSESDYVVYSSNRIYDAVPRLPKRYPMTIAYYQGMLDGSLGFDVVHSSSRNSSILGLEFPEQGADESWSLYDHPPVTVLRNSRRLTTQEIDAFLRPHLEGAQPGWVRPGSFLNRPISAIGEALFGTR